MSLNLAPTLNEAMKKPSKDKPKVPNNHLPDTIVGAAKTTSATISQFLVQCLILWGLVDY